MENLDKIFIFLLEEIKKNTIKEEDLTYVFTQHTQLKKYLLNEYKNYKIDISYEERGNINNEYSINKDKQNKVNSISLPLINILIYVINKHSYTNKALLKKVYEIFKDELEPFKEVYINLDINLNSIFQKNLVAGFDIFNLLKEKIVNVKNEVPLNIRTIEQLYSYIKSCYNKTNGSQFCGKMYSDAKLEEWYYDKNIVFNLKYEDVFFHEKYNEITYSLKISDQFFKDENFQAHSYFLEQGVELLKNIIKHKVLNNQIDFMWDTEKLITVITTSSIINDDETLFKLMSNVYQENSLIITKEIMTVLFLKNKKIYELMKEKIGEPMSEIESEKTEQLQKELNEKSIQNVNEYVKNIVSILSKNKDEDTIINKSWDKVKEQIDFLLEEKGSEFLLNNLEERVNFEQIVSIYIPKILENYFSIPARLRLNEKNNYIDMTRKQFDQISEELERLEKTVIEDSSQKMKVFGKFLNNRLSLEEINLESITNKMKK